MTPPDYDAALSAGAHRGNGRELVHLLKYRKVLTAAGFWTEWLARLATQFPPGEPFDLVVPVPLGRQRQRERGFNQSAELSRRLARHCHLRHAPAALERKRETLAQAGLTAEARHRNLNRAFAARSKLVQGRSILLVDDVLTTGTTANASALALKRAGAHRVCVLTATRADLWAAQGSESEPVLPAATNSGQPRGSNGEAA